MIRELSRRPSLLLCIALAGGMTAFDGLIGPALAIAVWCLAQGGKWRAGVAAFFAVGLALAPHPVQRIRAPATFRGEAAVVTVPRLSRESQFCEVEAGGLRYLLSAPKAPVLSAGDHLALLGEIRPITAEMAQIGSFRRQTAVLKVQEGNVKVMQMGAPIFRAGVEWRRSFAQFSADFLQADSAAATNALCFNMDADLDDRTYENLQRTGTIHIISASGLHVLIFAAGLRFLLAMLPIPRGWQLAIIGVMLVVYAIGAGMRPPVVRSVAMAGILGTASLLRREPDLLAALGVAAAGYLLWRPSAVFDVGFQLSFAAVAALGMFLGLSSEMPTHPWRRLGHGIAEVAKASAVATAATAPLMAYYFGTVSLVSIPANILIAVVLAPLTLGAFFAHGISALLPDVSRGIAVCVIEPLSQWILWIVNSLGGQSFAAFSVGPFTAYWMIPYFGLILILWRPRVRPV